MLGSVGCERVPAWRSESPFVTSVNSHCLCKCRYSGSSGNLVLSFRLDHREAAMPGALLGVTALPWRPPLTVDATELPNSWFEQFERTTPEKSFLLNGSWHGFQRVPGVHLQRWTPGVIDEQRGRSWRPRQKRSQITIMCCWKAA